MIDDDDAVHLLLHQALDDLWRVADQHHSPHLVIEEWILTVASVLLTDRSSGLSLEAVMLLCARRIHQDAVLMC